MKNSAAPTKNHLFARQGDVHFITREIPKTATRVPNRPFALGEQTGHSHRVIEAEQELFETYEQYGLTFIRVLGDIHIAHEDHDPSATTSVLPKGWEGQVVIAQEYDEEQGFRSVLD